VRPKNEEKKIQGLTHISIAEEWVVEELLEVDPVFGVPLKQVVQKVGEKGGGAGWYPRRQPGVLLVKLLQRLRCLGL
jgi:hypothetical protein